MAIPLQQIEHDHAVWTLPRQAHENFIDWIDKTVDR